MQRSIPTGGQMILVPQPKSTPVKQLVPDKNNIKKPSKEKLTNQKGKREE